MERKNTILLTVIAAATLLVAVAGATFAYFAANVQTNNTANINVTTPESNAVFDTVGNEVSLSLNVVQMSQAASASQSVSYSENATLNVSLLAGTSEATITCTYDIYYAWRESTDYYEKTEDAGQNHEFTYVISNADISGGETTEANFVDNTSEDPADPVAAVTGLSISNSSTSVATEKTYTITVKFYNLHGVNQTVQANKDFLLKFYVDNVVC